MKKTISLLLVAVMCLLLNACNQSTKNEECAQCAKYKDLIQALENKEYEKAIYEILEIKQNDSSENDSDDGNQTENSELEKQYDRILNWIEDGGQVRDDNGNYLDGQEATKYVYNWLTAHSDYKESATYLAGFTIVSGALTYIERIETDSFGQTTQTKEESYYYNEKGECFELSEINNTLKILGIRTDEHYNQLEYNENGVLIGGAFTSSYSDDSDLIVVRFKLEYDEKGNFTKADFQTNSGETWSNTFTYDENGRLIRTEIEKECDIINQNYKYSYIEEFEYSSDGKLVKKSHLMDKRYCYIEEYTYDENGRLKEMIRFSCDVFGDMTRENYKEVYTYDDQNRISSAKRGTCTLIYHYEDLYFYNAD